MPGVICRTTTTISNIGVVLNRSWPGSRRMKDWVQTQEDDAANDDIASIATDAGNGACCEQVKVCLSKNGPPRYSELLKRSCSSPEWLLIGEQPLMRLTSMGLYNPKMHLCYVGSSFSSDF